MQHTSGTASASFPAESWLQEMIPSTHDMTISAHGVFDATAAESSRLTWTRTGAVASQPAHSMNPLYSIAGPAPSVSPVPTALPVTRARRKPRLHGPQHLAPAIVPSSKVSAPPRRRQKPSVENIRKIRACWRCRKYKKTCDDGPVCSSCQVSGFRVWPSELGCRRERAHEMTTCYIPAEFEQAVGAIPPCTPKSLSWRRLGLTHAVTIPLDSVAEACGGTDVWDTARHTVRSLVAFGHDMEELVQIAETYQRGRSQPDRCLAKSCELLIATCQLYRCFVGLTSGESIPQPQTIIPLIAKVRENLYQTFILLERLCLSAKPVDWFAATMSVSLTTCAAIVFVDAMTAVPSPAREHTWGNYQERRQWMRYGSYNVLIRLLQASTKGINPIKLACFQPGDPTKPGGASNYDETLLPPIDEVSLVGGRQLNTWSQRHQASMAQAMQMFQMNLFEICEVRPIGAMFKIFDW